RTLGNQQDHRIAPGHRARTIGTVVGGGREGTAEVAAGRVEVDPDCFGILGVEGDGLLATEHRINTRNVVFDVDQEVTDQGQRVATVIGLQNAGEVQGQQLIV